MAFPKSARCSCRVLRFPVVGRPRFSSFGTGQLNQPFGLAFQNGYLYVGNTNSVARYKYTSGDTKAQGQPEKLADLPGDGNHPFRDVLFSRDGRKMYVSVGSSNNIDESGSGNERRATIHEYNPDGTGFRLFATGIRNPSVLTWQPGTNTLWTAVNERDGLGDELVPDYATSVKDGGFYGWPYSYFGNHVDTRVRNQQAGPRGQGDRSGHSDSGAFGGSWSDLLYGHSVSAALSQRTFRCVTWLVESFDDRRSQSHFCSVREQSTFRPS